MELAGALFAYRVPSSCYFGKNVKSQIRDILCRQVEEQRL
jgi:hypothetical protein